MLRSKDFDRQFAQLYFYRLHSMREHVTRAAHRQWPGTPGEQRGRLWGYVQQGWRARGSPCSALLRPAAVRGEHQPVLKRALAACWLCSDAGAGCA